jgi:hypothetical protein
MYPALIFLVLILPLSSALGNNGSTALALVGIVAGLTSAKKILKALSSHSGVPAEARERWVAPLSRRHVQVVTRCATRKLYEKATSLKHTVCYLQSMPVKCLQFQLYMNCGMHSS